MTYFHLASIPRLVNTLTRCALNKLGGCMTAAKDRLETLERQVRVLRITTAALSAVAATLLVAGAAPHASVPREIVATSVRLEDPEGTGRVTTLRPGEIELLVPGRGGV